MKNKWVKPFLAVCCAAALAGGIGVTAYAANAKNGESAGMEKSENADALQAAEDAEAASAENRVRAAGSAGESVKDETVYVLAGADGGVEKIIVSDWIKNSAGSAAIADRSELTDAENVKGDETYTMDGGNTRVWDAKGGDIYYQGEIKKELPVGLSVSYLLDGRSISAEELAGKSGKVTIRFDYENRQSETVVIDGKQEKIYVPFAVLTGMLLDNDVFANVEVTNGKLINDGNRTAVAGIAFPGLGENLNLDAEKLEIPDYVEITADVSGFEMANTVTIVTNGVFNGVKTDALETEGDLTASLGQLSTAMNQLMDGSSQLYDGLCTLLDKSQELIAGIDRLAAGAKELADGAAALDAGAEQLAGGAKELAGGLGTLAAGSDTLNAGAKQVFDSQLATAESQLQAAGLAVPKLTIENYAQVLDGVTAQLSQGGAAAADPAAVQQAKAAAAKIAALKQQLDSYNQFYLGLEQYTAGVASAKAGADQLQAGAGQLAGGAAQLDAGIQEFCAGILSMKEQAPALADGVTQLRDGSMQLSEGLKEFNEQGVQRLIDAVDGDLAGLVARIRATVDVSKEYRNFSGISDGMDGEVKFIYRTEAVAAGQNQ